MSEDFLISDEQLEELIHKYCRDLTALVRKDKFDPITGRDKEIREMILILLQRGRKNAAMLAPAGVGKTASVIGLAQAIVNGDAPEYLRDARVIEVDMPSMAAGTDSPAQFQERFIPLCKGIAERHHDISRPKIIIFIDEIHTIMPDVEGSAYRGLSEAIKPYLTAGDLHIIGATTMDEYKMYIAKDQALDRRFQQIQLAVPNKEETLAILEAIKKGYEKHHHITIPTDIVELIINLTDKHMPRRNQPDKSIIIMDGACAHNVMENGWNGTLSEKDVRAMVGTETKIHPDAL